MAFPLSFLLLVSSLSFAANSVPADQEIVNSVVRIYQQCIERKFMASSPALSFEQSRGDCLKENQPALAKVKGLAVAVSGNRSTAGTTAVFKVKATLGKTQGENEVLVGRSDGFQNDCSLHRSPDGNARGDAGNIGANLGDRVFCAQAGEPPYLYGLGFERVGKECKRICPTGQTFVPGVLMNMKGDLHQYCRDCSSSDVLQTTNSYNLKPTVMVNYYTTMPDSNRCVNSELCPIGMHRDGNRENGDPQCVEDCHAPLVKSKDGQSCVPDSEYCEKALGLLKREMFVDARELSQASYGNCNPAKLRSLASEYQNQIDSALQSYVERCKSQTVAGLKSNSASPKLPRLVEFLTKACSVNPTQFDPQAYARISRSLSFNSIAASEASNYLYPTVFESRSDAAQALQGAQMGVGPLIFNGGFIGGP